MKEIFRHYGSSIIAAMAGTVLVALIVGLPYASFEKGSTMPETTLESGAFEDYWRSR